MNRRDGRAGSTRAAGPVVLWLAAEAVPWASTGGLGDVVGSLPPVLRRRGWDVRLCLPLYRSVAAPDSGAAPGLTPERALAVVGGHRVTVREAIDPPAGIPTYFLDCPALFDRAGIYGDDGGEAYPDNPLRFAVFQIAARALAESLSPAPAILHSHDWHTALLPALLHFPGERPAALDDTRTVLTIHNLQYQGQSERALLTDLGLPRGLWHPAWAEHFDRVNPLKAGILSADRVTTVSPTYANEIRTSEQGLGLDGPLRERGGDLRAILNGIDVEAADPATDPVLPAHYGAGDLAGRARCKAALRKELGLPGLAGEPVVGYVGRMTEDKGVDLLAEAVPELVGLGAQVVAVGTGDRAVEAALSRREEEHAGRFRAVLRFDAALARRVYAGADVLVVPSRVEPCGLVQLYALRYGAVPVVHAVGGLRDTIRDGETGFLFHEPTVPALVAGVRRAIDAFRNLQEWARLREAGMTQDWSWTQSAAAYDTLYRELLAAPPLRRPPPRAVEGQQPPPDWGPDLPVRLGRTTIQLLVQGPGRLHAHWELRPDEGTESDPLQLLLEEQPTGLAFLIDESAPAVGARWLLAEPERAYRVALRRASGAVLAVSSAVVTPRDSAAGPGESDPAVHLTGEVFATSAARVVPGADRIADGGGAVPVPPDGGSGFLFGFGGSVLR